jgi:serine protease
MKKFFLISIVILVAVVFLSGCFLFKPDAPQLSVVSISDHSVTLEWSESSPVDGFKLYRGQNGNFDLIKNLDSSENSYTDSGLNPNTSYTYKMVAYRMGVNSDWSNLESVKTTYTVSGYILDESNFPVSNVYISITSNNGAVSTQTDENGYWAKSGLLGQATIEPQKSGWVFVPASKTVNGPSNQVNFTAIQQPGIPFNPVPQNGAINLSKDVTLQWSCTGSSLHYDVYFGTTSNPQLVASNIGVNSYKPSNLNYGTTYYWRITARNLAGSSEGPLWFFTTEATPINVSGYVKDSSGNPISNVSMNFSGGYSSVSTDQNGYWHKENMVGPVTVTPSKANWTFSPSSKTLTKSESNVNFTGTYTDNAPYAPHNPTPSNGAINVATNTSLSWIDSDPDGDALRYSVYLGTTSNPQLVASNIGVNFYKPSSLNYGTTYYWKVVASDGVKSTEGPVWHFKTVENTPSGTGTIYGKVDVYTGESAFVSSLKNDLSRQFVTNSNVLKAGRDYVKGEVVIGFSNDKNAQSLLSEHNFPFSYKIKKFIVTPDKKVNAALLEVSTDVPKAIDFLRKLPNVKYAEPNYIVHALSTPNDTYYSLQWNLSDIDVPQTWQVTKGANTVIVAVLDTGVSSTHPDLQGVLVPGYNFISNNTNTDDDYGHGTHVAGIIDADTNNGEGIAGVDWGETNSIKIMPVKVLDSSGSGNTTGIAEGIIYATKHGAKVINMSLGGDYSYLESAACQYAYDNGVTLVAAAGNENLSSLDYPAAFPTVIPVSAVGPDNARAYYSNYANGVIWAPGGDMSYENSDGILSTYYSTSTHTNEYAYMQGTSMAAPHVAAIAALMISNGITGPANIWNILKSTARAVSASTNYGGYGLVNAYDAVTYNGGWEPMMVWVENSYGSIIESTYMSDDGTFSMSVPAGTYKVYAWQDFNDDYDIDTGDFYGYFGYNGSASDPIQSVSVTDGNSFYTPIYVSPEIDDSGNPFSSIPPKILEYKRQVIKAHYESLKLKK